MHFDFVKSQPRCIYVILLDETGLRVHQSFYIIPYNFIYIYNYLHKNFNFKNQGTILIIKKAGTNSIPVIQ